MGGGTQPEKNVQTCSLYLLKYDKVFIWARQIADIWPLLTLKKRHIEVNQ